LLHKLEIFSELPEAQRATLDAGISKKQYAAGEIVLVHGESSTEVYFVIDGSLRATTYSSSGREICYQTLESGAMFGELSAIDLKARTTSIICQSDCTLGVMSADRLWTLMQEYPEIMAGVLKRLTSMVRFLCSRVYEYGALGTRERTRAEILRLANNNVVADGQAVINDMPTHEDIANRIASHREAVTKELSYLAKNGLIEKRGRTLIVPSIEALSATLVEGIMS